ncbi:hypothetical protein Tco_0400001 [Tanacetum coccineum]
MSCFVVEQFRVVFMCTGCTFDVVEIFDSVVGDWVCLVWVVMYWDMFFCGGGVKWALRRMFHYAFLWVPLQGWVWGLLLWGYVFRVMGFADIIKKDFSFTSKDGRRKGHWKRICPQNNMIGPQRRRERSKRVVTQGLKENRRLKHGRVSSTFSNVEKEEISRLV